jgi:hypothetical protein
MTLKKYLAGAAIAAGVLVGSNAQSATIDFSGAAEGGFYTNTAQSSNGPVTYTAQGFQFDSVGDEGHFHDNYLGFGTVLMHDNSPSSPDAWVLTKVGGGLFDVTSFTAFVSDGMRWFTNLNPSGTDAVNGLNVINVSGISSLSFVLRNPGACCSEGMDAFEVNSAAAVPEPETYAMLLAGLGLIGFAARRRKQQAA